MNGDDDHDFRALRERLERAKEATERWLTPDAEASRRILDARARALARRADAGADDVAETAALMFFHAAGERFAVDLRWVLGVSRIAAIEPIPGGPAVFRGVVNHRGKVLPVVDLGALLTSTPKETAATCILVLGDTRPELGLTVDQADEVIEVPVASIDRASVPAWIDRASFARGMLEGRCVVLDGRLLLDDPRLTLSRNSP